MEFSTRAMRKVIESQTDKRISDSGADELGRQLESYAEKVTEKAVKEAENNGRKTVRAGDIREALRDLR